MIRYKVKVEILKIDEKGEQTWDVIREDFQDKDAFKARCKAIERLKSLLDFFLVELSDEINFSSLEEGRKEELKNVNFIFPELLYIDNDGWPNEIYGRTLEVVDGLNQEVIYYRMNHSLKKAKRINSLGDIVDVLEADIKFLLH